MTEGLRRGGTTLGVVLVHAYRCVLGPHLGGACRFEPSCSVYAEQCLTRHGLLAGARLAVGRVLRCRPGVPGGFDPAP